MPSGEVLCDLSYSKSDKFGSADYIRLGFKSVKTSFLKFFQDQLSRLTAQQGMLYEEHYKLKTDLKTKSAAQQINNSDSDLQVQSFSCLFLFIF